MQNGGGRRENPYAFMEQGVAMRHFLSGLGEENVLLQQGGLHLGRGAERNTKRLDFVCGASRKTTLQMYKTTTNVKIYSS